MNRARYKIILDEREVIAEMNAPIKVVITVTAALTFVYKRTNLQIYSATKEIKFSETHSMDNLFSTSKNSEYSRDKISEIMYMHTSCPPESNTYSEKPIAIMRLPENSMILEIGGFLLNHMKYDSIDILKDKGVDGKYKQLIELDQYNSEGIHFSLHCGELAAWKHILHNRIPKI